MMGERNLGKIKFDWQPQFWISCLRYWHDSATGLLSNKITFHIPAKHTDLNIFISQFLSPPMIVHHNHCCIINNPSSVYMCMFVAQMEKSSAWSTVISVKGTIWGFGKNSEVCSSMSVWETVQLKHALQLTIQVKDEVTGKRKEFTYFNGTNQEAILIRSECEQCAGEGGVLLQNSAGNHEAFPG